MGFPFLGRSLVRVFTVYFVFLPGLYKNAPMLVDICPADIYKSQHTDI